MMPATEAEGPRHMELFPEEYAQPALVSPSPLLAARCTSLTLPPLASSPAPQVTPAPPSHGPQGAPHVSQATCASTTQDLQGPALGPAQGPPPPMPFASRGRLSPPLLTTPGSPWPSPLQPHGAAQLADEAVGPEGGAAVQGWGAEAWGALRLS